MRVIALAYKTDVNKNDTDFTHVNDVESDMVFVGLLGVIGM
jgi:magnesium-transporting ATPase (P-type)